jgi:ABC-2 type transport system permease protein
MSSTTTDSPAPILPNFQNIGTIFLKELRSFFNSAVAYVVIVVFLGIVGWFFTSNLFLFNVSSMRMFFDLAPMVFLFVIPAITMRLLAEEKKTGTIELLSTKPLNDVEIVLGKFFAAWALIALSLVPSLIYYITIASIGSIDNGPVIGGYIGLLLLAGVYISVGVLASSITDNQIIAFIVGFLLVFFFFILDKILMYVPGFLTGIVEYLGADYHFSSITRGVIDSRDIVYFISVLGFMLYLSVVSLGRRKW